MESKRFAWARSMAPRWTHVALGDGPGGIMLRRVLLPAIGLFALIGWTSVEIEALGIYDTPLGTTLMVLAASLLFTALGWRCAQTLENLERRALLMADSVPSLVWTSDPAGRVTSVNRRWEAFTGAPPEAALGAGWLEFVHPEDRERTLSIIARALREKRDFVLEHRFRIAGSGYCFMMLAGRAWFGPAGAFMGHVGSSTDVTSLESMVQAFTEGEQRLRLFMKVSNIGLWDWNVATGELYLSPEWKGQLGYRDEELPNRYEEWESRLHSEDRESLLQHLNAYLRGPVSAGAPAYEAEFRMRHRDGSYRWIYTHAERLGEQRMLGCHVDVTDLKRAEEDVRSLTRRLLDAEETERRALSRELHDRVGQNLSALSLNLQLIRQQLPERSEERIAERLEQVQSILQATTRQVRDVMVELRPPGLDDYGLATALRNYAERAARGYPARLTVSGEDPCPRLALEVETALFRIAQEALTNTAKHAAARNVQVRLEDDAGRVRMTVADDGVGFDPGRDASASSLGMVTMRERAAAVGARLRIESAPGRGTRLAAEVMRTVRNTREEARPA